MTKKLSGLTQSQREFFEYHGVPLSEVICAEGMGALYKKVLKDLDYLCAYNVDRSCQYGHRIRNRHGHCMQCNSFYFARKRRDSEPGYVYLAYSETEDLFKIGACQDVDVRVKNLNKQIYGGASDWAILHFAFSGYCYRAETRVSRALSAYRKLTFRHSGNYEDSLETYVFPEVGFVIEIINEYCD